MEHREYVQLTPETLDVLWSRLRAGHAVKPTARALGMSPPSVRAYLVRFGGIRRDPRTRAAGRLSLGEREEISRGLAAGWSLRKIAQSLGRSASTVSREVATNGGRRDYRAAKADRGAWRPATRPKRCKLATNRRLSGIVAAKLAELWSPQQIAGWLKTEFLPRWRCRCRTRRSIAPCSSSPGVRSARN